MLNLVPSVIIRPFKLNFDSKCCNDPLFFKRSSKPEGTYTKCFSKMGITCEKNSGREHQQQFETRSCVGCRWAKVMSLFLFFFIFISNYFVPLSTSSSVVVLLAHRLIHPTLKAGFLFSTSLQLSAWTQSSPTTTWTRTTMRLLTS